ncbi:UDP-N-acetylmuramoyl-L-alanyl-D-glutamate--2,6-diaminopimelate ligase [Microbacterium bovistercoris]|uniref:UDP-N-acetylmuramyl-tripeptide synthetase n=1 Tax=Microbacterium bovistercoris TaxID=2293570 RepID=A0A371NVW6_9MICO|nr:UDP-N-acetylmuramoyl-L-alanyl-D-glutamate--2,6-diaminopimelate ligase [Microbacterium bovistercoris]REJ06630.1 UDP-N-acetylmuramoyl-L-alanyl-D-glutamate--2,6-diaminopimelate ligase [Microbacterium bovistercoris]
MATAPASAPLPPVLRPENPPHRSLSDLAERFGLGVRGDLGAQTITGITLATADLRAGEVFVGIHGARRHGAEFAGQAAEQGAVAILTDAEGAEIAAPSGLPLLIADDPRAVLGAISAWLYGTDADMPTLLAVTGTNGKTSTAHVLEAILDQIGVVTGLSSTAERHIAGQTIVSRLTTPESSELHALLALMRERDVAAVAVEVSAQALSRHRVDGLLFDVAGFTNLTHDHLDDYGDLETYLEAKLALFRPDRARRGVVCVDTASGREVVARSQIPVVTVGAPQLAQDADAAADADWIVRIDEETQRATTFTVRAPGGDEISTTIPVIGAHMAANTGLAIAMLVEAGYDFDRIAAVLERDGGVRAVLPGRTEIVSGEQGPVVYVDFSHTPDSFEKTLAAVRKVTPGRVLMMFGASGNRDTLKRPIMGRVAAEGADVVIVTDHHPRYEEAAPIRAALLDGARSAGTDAEIIEVAAPEEAIRAAVSMTGEGDAILWAGPGHQDYREINGVRTPFSARALARQALQDAGWPVPDPR